MMRTKESPDPRANAGSRADFKAEHSDTKASAIELEAGAAAELACVAASHPVRARAHPGGLAAIAAAFR